MFRFMKTFGNYSPNMGAELRVVITGQPVNFGDLKPELHPTSLLGKVSVRFIKKRMFGVKLYGRLRGEEEWKYLGIGRRSPFIDKRPLATEEKPEIREYKAMCYDGQREIGLESDMVSVVHAG